MLLSPSGAVLEVELRDVSLQDAASVLITSQTIENPERFPLTFAIDYDPEDIDPRATYSVQARVTLDSRLIYINDTAFEVLTRGNPSRDVDMRVVAVGGGA